MDEIKDGLIKAGFNGDVDDSATAKDFYSHDASMFELRPKLILLSYLQ